jgi:hypothetical protein
LAKTYAWIKEEMENEKAIASKSHKNGSRYNN